MNANLKIQLLAFALVLLAAPIHAPAVVVLSRVDADFTDVEAGPDYASLGSAKRSDPGVVPTTVVTVRPDPSGECAEDPCAFTASSTYGLGAFNALCPPAESTVAVTGPSSGEAVPAARSEAMATIVMPPEPQAWGLMTSLGLVAFVLCREWRRVRARARAL